MSAELILVEREQDIATVILNRPEKLNALTKPMWQQLGEAMRSLSADDSLRCIVVRGAGEKSFAPGNDISEFSNTRSNSKDAKTYGEVHHEALAALYECRHPMVALIQGICVGGGLEIAIRCHSMVAIKNATLQFPEISLGILPGIGGCIVANY